MFILLRNDGEACHPLTFEALVQVMQGAPADAIVEIYETGHNELTTFIGWLHREGHYPVRWVNDSSEMEHC